MSGKARAVVFPSAPVAAAALLLCHGLAAHAQVDPAAEAPTVQAVPDLPTINVIAVTPLPDRPAHEPPGHGTAEGLQRPQALTGKQPREPCLTSSLLG